MIINFMKASCLWKSFCELVSFGLRLVMRRFSDLKAVRYGETVPRLGAVRMFD